MDKRFETIETTKAEIRSATAYDTTPDEGAEERNKACEVCQIVFDKFHVLPSGFTALGTHKLCLRYDTVRSLDATLTFGINGEEMAVSYSYLFLGKTVKSYSYATRDVSSLHGILYGMKQDIDKHRDKLFTDDYIEQLKKEWCVNPEEKRKELVMLLMLRRIINQLSGDN